jgi:hypothetical protein
MKDTVSIKRRLRTIVCCFVLQVATLIGVPMRPDHVQELMHSLNQPKLARTTPEEKKKDGARSRSQKDPSVSSMTQAKGTFDVKVIPQGAPDTAEGIALGRMSLDKQFHGALQAVSKGEMLTSGLESNGSAAYVAIERVIGTLDGRKGSFALMHQGTMNKVSQKLTVVVVPDSGTGELTGLTGTMTINIIDKKHLYEFSYTLPTR